MKYQKRYDPIASQKYDGPAKIVAAKILENKGLEVFSHERAQQYLYDHCNCEPNTISDTDLIDTDVIYRNLEGRIVCVELEVRGISPHTGESYFDLLRDRKYRTYHVPFRKIGNKNVSDIYIFFNYQLSEYGFIKYSDILLFPDIKVKCRNKPGEPDSFKDVDNTEEYIKYYKVPQSCLPQKNGLIFDEEEMYWKVIERNNNVIQ
jgi:hypothetical protein